MPELPVIHGKANKFRNTSGSSGKSSIAPRAHNDGNALARQRQAKRQYRTNSKPWRAIRRRVLSSEPLCRICMAAGEVVAATDVDHIDDDPWNNEPDNLQPLCRSCHSRKTATEMAGNSD